MLLFSRLELDLCRRQLRADHSLGLRLGPASPFQSPFVDFPFASPFSLSYARCKIPSRQWIITTLPRAFSPFLLCFHFRSRFIISFSMHLSVFRAKAMGFFSATSTILSKDGKTLWPFFLSPSKALLATLFTALLGRHFSM